MIQLLGLVIHAAESRVHVLVVCLEPVAKRRTKHARSSARRSALHDEVFAIEKIGRVTAVERKRLESREWCEDRGRPLPTIAQHVVYAERALALGEGIYRRGIPMAEIKIAEARTKLLVGPWILPFYPVVGSIGGAVPLLFARKRFTSPARVRHRLGMTHINWPVQRQRNFFEHRAVEPFHAHLAPEHRMRDCVRRLPFPIAIAPERFALIATGSHKIEVLPACHLVLINLKRGHVHRVSFVLVVPTEDVASP